MESVLLDTMYELPSMKNVSKVVVDEGVVTGETKPYIIYQSEEATAPAESEEAPRPTGSGTAG